MIYYARTLTHRRGTIWGKVRQKGSKIESAKRKLFHIIRACKARLAQSVERKTLNLVVVGSSPTMGVIFSPKFLWKMSGSAMLKKKRVMEQLPM